MTFKNARRVCEALRVLMLSPEFPPVGGGATTRVTKLVRYLAREGVSLEVIAEPPRGHHPIDRERLEQLPSSLAVHRLRPPARWIAFLDWLKKDRFRGALRLYHLIEPGFPDRLCWWCLGAWPQARLAAARADVLWSTGPPYSTHLLGYALQQQFGLPWMMDCRDPWTESFIYRGVGLRRRLERSLEGKLLRSADRVVAVTQSLTSSLRDHFGAQVEYVPNGFDPEDLPQPAAADAGLRRLVYAGVLNRQRDPEPLARAILSLDRNDIRLDLLGPLWRELGPACLELQRRGQLLLGGELTHQQALAAVASADVALVLGEFHPDSTLAVGGKVYELLALGIPVLGLVLEGEMSQILRDGGARVVHPLDESAINLCLAEMLDRPRQLKARGGRDDPHAYPTIARRLLQLLNDMRTRR